MPQSISALDSLAEIEKFESLFCELPAALSILRGPDFLFEMANQEYLRLVGRSRIVGKTLLEALPELVDQPFPDLLKEVFATGKEYRAREAEVQLALDPKKPNELSTRFVDVTYRRIKDREGSPYGIFVFALDVTEKVQARRAIQVEQQKLEAVFTNAAASLAILEGPHAVFANVNDSYAGLFSGRELLGKPVLEALPELATQKFPELLARVYQTGETYHEIEAVAFLRRTSSSPLEKRYFDQSYIGINDVEGKRYGVLVEAIDVTERVTQREMLAESENRFRAAVDAARMGTWNMLLPEQNVEWSKRSAEIFGFPPDAAISVEESLQNIHAEDLPRVREALAKAMDPNGSGAFSVEFRIDEPGKSIRWVAARGQAIFSATPTGPAIQTFSGSMIDVTDRVESEEAVRKSERLFRLMSDVMPQMVWTASADGVVDYANARWRQYSGSENAAAWLRFAHPEDLTSAEAAWKEAVSRGQDFQSELRFREANGGAYRWFLVRGEPSLGKNKSVERWFLTGTDIQEQRAALHARNEFMSIASHELKTPLTSLKLQTQTMRRNFEKGRTEFFSTANLGSIITSSNRQVDRLVRLVDEMLDFAKIEAGRLTMQKEKADVGEIAREVFGHLREQMESSGCRADFESENGAVASVDRFRIEQVITNLLTNGIRYGRGRPIKLVVSSVASSVLVSVTDEGIGIAPENQARIFNRFERAVSPNEVSGLGLGLFISREIVEAHGGRIWVDSELGRGSTFFVSLPK